MSDALEGNRKKQTWDADSHVLYVPEGVSWEMMFAHGVRQIRSGYSVWMHEHSYEAACTPNGRCGQLTDTPDGVILEAQQAQGQDQN